MTSRYSLRAVLAGGAPLTNVAARVHPVEALRYE